MLNVWNSNRVRLPSARAGCTVALVAVIVTTSTVMAGAATPRDMSSAQVVESSYDLEQTVDNIEQAAVGNNFRVIGRQYHEALTPILAR